jgi:hypothetical protein
MATTRKRPKWVEEALRPPVKPSPEELERRMKELDGVFAYVDAHVGITPDSASDYIRYIREVEAERF